MLEMIFNELSVRPADDLYTARQWMMTFVQTVKSAAAHGVARSLRTMNGMWELALAADYPLRRWLNDPGVDREARRYILTLSAKFPLWDGLPDLYDRVLTSEFYFDGRPACGLGVAGLLEDLAVSLPSQACWNAARLDLCMMSMAETPDEDNPIQKQLIQVVHASQDAHIDTAWVRERLRRDVQDGSSLWGQRAKLLPRLVMCEAVGRQLQNIEPTMLPSVVRRLFELDAHCQRWTDGGFDKEGLANATPESQAALEQYANERTFMCPDDQERTFSWRIRLTPGAWRIYFYPVPEDKMMIIGYIGPHLSTAKYH